MSQANTTELGEQIRKRRKLLALTQLDLSQLSGASLSYIHDLENGKATVQLGKLIDVARVLGLELTLTPRETTDRVPSR